MDEEIHAKLPQIKELVSEAASDEELVRLRKELAVFSSSVFFDVGNKLHILRHTLGTDRRDGASPFGFGSDEVVAVSMLLRIGGELIAASVELLTEGRPYAGAALLRQIVEVEYLAWAFDTRDLDAQRWLRSDKVIREQFFRPAKLREAAEGKFRGKDYGFHCELGGHPVPTGSILLRGDAHTVQLLVSDLIGHSGNIWDHFIGWTKRHEQDIQPFAQLLKAHAHQMSERYNEWKFKDPLAELPPCP